MQVDEAIYKFKKEKAMSVVIAGKIQSNPKYLELVKQRDSLAWALSAVVCVLYFGFTMMIAFTPGILTTPISSTSVIPVGMLIGVGLILASCVLTGVYVYKANSTFDPLIQQLMEEASK